MDQRGFSMGELLVAIAIVGVLTAIVVGLAARPSRERAIIAKGLNFSGQISHSLSDEIGLNFDFENVSGGQVKDVSGNGNHGTIVSGSQVDGLSGLGRALTRAEISRHYAAEKPRYNAFAVYGSP